MSLIVFIHILEMFTLVKGTGDSTSLLKLRSLEVVPNLRVRQKRGGKKKRWNERVWRV